MKYLKKSLFMAFIFAIIFSAHSVSAQDDLDLEDTLRALKQNRHSMLNRRLPNLPTDEDINQLESTLFRADWKLPNSLKTYHLTLGNLIFGGVSFPSVHRIENNGKFRSDLLYFIRDGHERGIPYNTTETWIPFCQDGEDYVCMNLQTGSVCYFSFIPRLKKEKNEYDNLSSWIKERLLPK